jgi:BirA family biotin operon repressor/biotin-[acetyl-CoA-carboxylase] ligase
LQNNTFSGLFVGQNLVTLTEVDSTNNFLKQAVANSTPLPEGTVIMAEAQLAGRGQQQNKWHSQPGKNLTFSILLKPTFLAIDAQFDLNMVVSTGIANALENIPGLKPQIKWPNDIYVNNGKLGGILIENLVQGSKINNSVIGIGLNINQEQFSAEVPNAVSLKQILHKDYDLKTILYDICSHIEANYLKLRAGGNNMLKTTYISKLYRYQQLHSFKAGQNVFNGTIEDVTRTGQLQVNVNGQLQTYNFKEIEFLN